MTIAVAELQSQLLTDTPDVVDTDIAIIGSGMGGGTLAYALRDCGADVSDYRTRRLPAGRTGELVV